MARAYLYILIASLFFACRKNPTPELHRRVQIVGLEGSYVMLKDGKPFIVKGAGGDGQFSELSLAGGNTLRVWDTTNLSMTLDSAHKYRLSVIVGLPVFDNAYLSFYKDANNVERQFRAIKSLVNKHKDHPALLMWCLGNELTWGWKPSYNNFYGAFDDMLTMIHEDDPDHPVTTALLNFDLGGILNLKWRSNLDLVSFNIYGGIRTLKRDLKWFSWIWDGPYLLSEWGIDGAWKGRMQTAWGAYMEDPSTKKADSYWERYQQNVPFQDKRFLGACVFFWGHKQEGTHTWFSMFDNSGAPSEAVDIMKYIWTGKKSVRRFPRLKYMLVNKKGAQENIILFPDQDFVATVVLEDTLLHLKKITWELCPEDWFRKGKTSNNQKFIPLVSQTFDREVMEVKWKTPPKEGPYRIFATIYDKNGTFATCNTPFYVVKE